MAMKMVKQATFSSAEEIVDLHIIDFNRCNGCWNNNSLRAINTAASWMVGHMGYTIIDIVVCRNSVRFLTHIRSRKLTYERHERRVFERF